MTFALLTRIPLVAALAPTSATATHPATLAAASTGGTLAGAEGLVSVFLNLGTAVGVLVYILGRVNPAIEALGAKLEREIRETRLEHFRTQEAVARLTRALLVQQLEAPDLLSAAGRRQFQALLAELDQSDARREQRRARVINGHGGSSSGDGGGET